MKKCRYFVFTGIFIVVTVWLCNMYKDNVPPKNENFKAPSQIISLINNNDLKVIDSDGGYVNTKIYNECLSYRKRVTDDDLNYSRLKLKECKDFSPKDKQSAIKEYKRNLKNFKDIKIPKGIKAQKFVGTASSDFGGSHNNQSHEENIELTIIFIKENNGYVIDGYYLNSQSDNSKASTDDTIS